MKLLKVTGILLLLAVILICFGGIYVKAFLPNTGEPADIQIERTPERIARGEYLANHVTVCMDCHGTRDWSRFAGPMVLEDAGRGGELFSKDMGFPGTI